MGGGGGGRGGGRRGGGRWPLQRSAAGRTEVAAAAVDEFETASSTEEEEEEEVEGSEEEEEGEDDEHEEEEDDEEEDVKERNWVGRGVGGKTRGMTPGCYVKEALPTLTPSDWQLPGSKPPRATYFMGGLRHGQLQRRDGSMEVPCTGPLAGDPCASFLGLVPQPQPGVGPIPAAAAAANAVFANPGTTQTPPPTEIETNPAPIFVGSTAGAESRGGLLAPGSLGSMSLVPSHMVQQLPPPQNACRLGSTSGLARRTVRQVEPGGSANGAHAFSGQGLLHRRQGAMGAARGSIAALQEHQHRMARLGGVGAWGGAGASGSSMAGHHHYSHGPGGAAGGGAGRAGWRAGLQPLSLGALQHDES
ncbi:hypothetical protein DUNSADRAFT_1139, partial [Dunaliella salina]